MPSIRIAHLSDLHFSKICWGINQFFSKRWIGNFNFLLRRRKEFDYSQLEKLLPIFLEKKVQKVLISGDLSCTSLKEEFLKASFFTDLLKNHGIETIILPGNHDHYTKKDHRKKTFYDFFASQSAPNSLKKDRLEVIPLGASWWMIGLDTTLSTHLFSCKGKFPIELEQKLEETLELLPKEANIILANHFPILLKSDRSLQREEALVSILKRHPKIQLYLHGHTHHRRISDYRNLGLPIVSDSGSAAHRFKGSWNLIDCSENSFSISPYLWENESWAPENNTPITWRTL